MRVLRAWFIRLTGIFGGGRRDLDLAAELESHLQLQIDDNMRAGMTAAEARRAALIRLGGMEAVKERYRDRVGVPAVEHLVRDLRHGVRSLLRTPWYSAAVLCVVALGMTLATTVFAIVDGVLFKPLPYPDAHQLYVISAPFSNAASIRDVREWAAAVPEARVAPYQFLFRVGAVGMDRPRRIQAAGVGPTFFSVLGVAPLLGGFQPEHFAPSTGVVPALISYALWQEQFGGRIGTLGSRLEVAGAVNNVGVLLPGVQVVGVLPKDFVFPDGEGTPDLLVPIALTAEGNAERNLSQAKALVRIPPTLPVLTLKQRLDAVAATEGFPLPGRPGARGGVDARPVQALLLLFQRGEFQIAFAMAATIVVLACVNVAGLGLARRRQRVREYAMRQALGASQWQLVRLMICEVTPLVVAGAVAGLVLAAPVMRTVVHLMPSYVVLLKAPTIDWRALVFSGAATAAAIFFAVLAQGWTRQSPLAEFMAQGGVTTPRRGRLGSVLVAVQAGLALALTVGGVLLVSSLWLAWHQDPGYQSDQVVVFDINLGTGTSDQLISRADTVIRTCREIGGVDQVAVVGMPFLQGSSLGPAVRRPAGAAPGREQSIPISGDFFSMLGLQALQGRVPTDDELRQHDPVTVVSERVSKAYWPGQSPIGKVLTSLRGDRQWTVIGVVRDARYGSLDTAQYGQIYRSFEPFFRSTVLIHGRASLDQTLRDAPRQLRTVPGVGVMRAVTMTEALGESIQTRRFRAWLFGGFAFAALGVAGIGILGMTLMSTARRTREMGLRFALGATRAAVIGGLLREQMRAVVIGLLGGGLVAAWSVRLLKSYLYQFTGQDPRLWAIAVATVSLAAFAGVLVPAVRASRIDPMIALRTE